MIRMWGVLVPEASDLPALPRGVVLHWSGGASTCGREDWEAYHFCVDHDAKVHAGRWPVAANMRRLNDSRYAHHTGGRNSYTVGVSGAGMYGYVSPKNPGRHLLNEAQVHVMCGIAGYFAWLGRLDPEKVESIGTHQEQWTRLGIAGQDNKNKTDIEYLPFKPQLTPHEVGSYLRKHSADFIRDHLIGRQGQRMPVLRYGSAGPEVGRVQDILGVVGPDVFGPATTAAVKRFQRSHGLVADGIVGNATWPVLLEEESRRKRYY